MEGGSETVGGAFEEEKEVGNETGSRTNEARQEVVVEGTKLGNGRREGAAKVEVGKGWAQQVLGAWALLGCALIWGGASWFEASRSSS